MAWFRSKASKRTAYPATTEGRVVYAVGDIHGRSDLLVKLFDAIDADAAARDGEEIEVYLGDFVDRGMDSKGVVDLLVGRLMDRRRSRRMVFVAGNHEELFSAFLAGAVEPEEWRRAGGFETALSYGVDVRALAGASRDRWVAAMNAQVPRAHRIFLEALRDSFALDGYFFTHAGVRPGVALDEQDPEDLRWIRDEFLGDRRDHGAIVVHGHTPTAEPEFRSNRINLDTGAYLSNRLTCLVIDGNGPRLL